MKRLTLRVWTLPNELSYDLKHGGSSFSDFWTVTRLLGQYVTRSLEKTNSIAWDLRCVSFSVTSRPAIKYETGLPGVGRWRSGL